MNNINLSNEVKKAVAKNEYYSTDQFINDAIKWVEAIKEGRVICTVASVSKSGMSRELKFLSCEPSKYNNEQGENVRYSYRQYNIMLECLGFKFDRKSWAITVNGCGMDMIFNTNYTIMHNFKSMGIITESECSSYAQMTPTNF
jgi:hypothetical protein